MKKTVPDSINSIPSSIFTRHTFFSSFFSFFFNLTYSRWTSSLPSCLWSQRIFPSLPGSRLTIFYRDESSALLQLVNQWLNFTKALHGRLAGRFKPPLAGRCNDFAPSRQKNCHRQKQPSRPGPRKKKTQPRPVPSKKTKKPPRPASEKINNRPVPPRKPPPPAPSRLENPPPAPSRLEKTNKPPRPAMNSKIHRPEGGNWKQIPPHVFLSEK